MKRMEEENLIEIQKIDTHQEIANIAGVGRTTVVRYSQILAHASQPTLNKLNKGDISIGSAHKLIENKIGKTPPIKKQPSQSKDNDMIEFSNHKEALDEMIGGNIDAIIEVKNQDDLEIIKRNIKLKIGVVIWK